MSHETAPNTKTLTVSIWTALGILGSAILVSVVGTAFAVAGTANSDHFLLQSTALAVTELKLTTVSKDVYEANQASLSVSLRDIKTQLEALNLKLDNK